MGSNVIEDYAQEVGEALALGLDVPALTGATFYVVECRRGYRSGLRDWDHESYRYFANRKSAENYFTYKLYESTCSILKKYPRKLGDEPRSWTQKDFDYMARNLRFADLANMNENLLDEIRVEMYNKWRSDTLLNIFLTQDYKTLQAWHLNCLRYSEIFVAEKYDIESKTIDSYPMPFSTAQQDAVLYEALMKTPVLGVQNKASQKIYFDSEEALRIAIELGAAIDTIPGTFLHETSTHPYYDGVMSKTDFYTIYQFATEVEATLMGLTYQIHQLQSKHAETPWRTESNVTLIDESSWQTHDDWFRDAVQWIKDNSYEAFLEVLDARRREFHLHLEGIVITKHYIEEDFSLTYGKLKTAEKLHYE